MRSSYRRTREDKKNAQQLILAVLGIISLIFILFYVGIPFLIKLSSTIAGFKKETPIENNNSSDIIFEPFLDTLPEATNSGQIIVTGNGTEGQSVVLYLNGRETEEKIIGKDGNFAFKNIALNKGINEIYAISKLKDKESIPSQTQNITYSTDVPKLEITAPENGKTFKREENSVEITGKTDPQATITINDRLIFVDTEGNFTATFNLKEGENKLEITAANIAGNSEKATLTVNYQP